MTNTPSPTHLLRWFDPRHRKLGTWAFIINRVTALGLTFYLFLHLIMLGQLAQGPDAYDSFIAFAQSPLIKFGEMLVIAGGILHGLNGIRIALTSYGIGTKYQSQIFMIIFIMSLGMIAYFGIRVFSGA